jgi:hypothetical protein
MDFSEGDEGWESEKEQGKLKDSAMIHCETLFSWALWKRVGADELKFYSFVLKFN